MARWALLTPHVQALADRWPADDPDTNLAYLLTWTSAYLASQGATRAVVDLQQRALAIHERTSGPTTRIP